MNKFKIQEKEYEFPYHYLVDLNNFNNKKVLSWGLEYFSYMKYTIDYIKKLEFEDLLDVGCGDGKLIHELSNKFKNKRFVGVDMSESAILLAKGINYGKNNCEFIYDDFGNLEEKFDVVVLNEVIEHIPNDLLDDFINKLFDKVKDGGNLIITVPSDNFPVQKKHYRHYNVDMLKKQFSNLKIKKINYIYKYNLFTKYIVAIWNKFNLSKKILENIGEKFIFKAKKIIVGIYL